MARLTPTNSSQIASVASLRTGSAFGKEYVCDRVQEKLFDFPALSNATGPADLMSQGTGTAVVSEINTSEICGMFCDTSTDSLGALWLIPDQIDLAQAIDVRVLWSNSEAAATGSLTLTALYTPLTAGTTAIAVGATACGTAIVADVDLAANVLNWSPYGTIAASVLTGTPGDDLLAWHIAATLTTIADATLYMGMIRYYREYV